MKTTIKTLPQSQVEITVELGLEELKPHLQTAAEQLAKETVVPGWRPGTASYEVIKQKLGEMKIYAKALNKIVDKTLWQAITERGLETIGQPEVNIEKMAPGNNFVYRVRLSLLPKITLADWRKIKVERRPVAAEEKELNEVLTDLRKSLASEALVERPAQKNDKVVVDMNLFLDKVPVEGGQTKDHQVFLGEEYYVPGLPPELLGLKIGEEKDFALPFPSEHFQKNLAGKNVDFKIKIKGVFERTLPPLDDTLAAKVGQPNLAELKELIKKNLAAAKGQKEERRLEIEIIQTLARQSSFDELPPVLVESEKRKMFAELKASLEERGLNFDQYLQDIKKTPEEVVKGFEEGAAERAKSALLLRQIAKQEKITNTEQELTAELARLGEVYKNSPNIGERLNQPDLLEFVAANLINHKIMEMLKKQMAE